MEAKLKEIESVMTDHPDFENRIFRSQEFYSRTLCQFFRIRSNWRIWLMSWKIQLEKTFPGAQNWLD